jgi:hypothetical protein
MTVKAIEKGEFIFGDTIVLPEGRASYPSLDKPKTEGQYPSDKYEYTHIFLSEADAMKVKAKIDAFAKQLFPKLHPDALMLGIKEKQDGWQVKSTNKNRPQYKAQDGQSEFDPTKFYGGCYVRAKVQMMGYYSADHIKGVSLKLKAVQFLKDGPRFGVDDEDIFFDAYESTDEGWNSI